MADKTGATSGTAPARMRGWLRVLLAVSLAANLTVIGVVVGAGLRESADRRAMPPETVRGAVRDMGLVPLMEAFPPEHRRALGRALRDQAGVFAPDRAALAGEIAAMLDILRIEPFDRPALEAILDSQRARLDKRLLAGRTAVLDQIAAMTPSERAHFADALERSLERALDDARRPPPPPDDHN